ncbi:ABC transporter substrate-binding protein [Photobacterium damselae subsp. damselae]|uniref:ABC transporter substrate-binding protein n=1 Tax=Photobacterium damselae TaxID=38293 RepID=UPI000D074DFC|nr:ABC transporter substrate-binding protein [Photobacterium damselae]NVO61084.1 ABC transporter substrate-binding protein [Photobacterium damselae subsp. damselae]PSB91504.1 ABC transporter substrate-binding protein [Photobacterium damselae subsp. damselae]
MKLKATVALVCSLISASAMATSTTRTVIDDTGAKVVLPNHPIERVADAWYSHTTELMALGEGDKIVATINHPESRPWMFKIQPSLNHALLGQGKIFNIESLLNRDVQLAFVMTGNPQRIAMESVNIPVVQVHFTTLEGLQKTMLITAKAMGSEKAMVRAKEYNQYLQHQLKRIKKKTEKLTEQQRPKVLHISSLNPLKVDGQGTLISDWISIAGGRNVAEVKGTMQPVSAEQILAWQPDIVILQGDAGDIKQSPEASLLEQLKAVKDGHVLRNPLGVFTWDRYGPESALQIQWAAKAFHPELFKHDNVAKITQEFYQHFFDYSLTPEQASRILQALPPRS